MRSARPKEKNEKGTQGMKKKGGENERYKRGKQE